MQVFKDCASEDEIIRTDATYWFTTNDVKSTAEAAGLDPEAVLQVGLELLKMKDLTQRRAFVDEIIDRYKKLKGGQ